MYINRNSLLQLEVHGEKAAKGDRQTSPVSLLGISVHSKDILHAYSYKVEFYRFEKKINNQEIVVLKWVIPLAKRKYNGFSLGK